MLQYVIMHYVIIKLFLNCIYFLWGLAFECFSTLGTNKKWNENGNPTECKLEAGYSIRKCVSFRTGEFKQKQYCFLPN